MFVETKLYLQETSIIPANFVLIEIDNSNDRIKIGETELYIDTSFEVGQHAPVYGRVLSVCEKLIMSGNHPMPWKTGIDIRKGDEIIVSFSAICEKLGWVNHSGSEVRMHHKDAEYEKHGDKIRLFVHYKTIWGAKRGDELIACNGYNLLKKVDANVLLGEKNIDGFNKDYLLQKNGKVMVAEVEAAASYTEYSDALNWHDAEVSVGDLIIYRSQAEVLLEHPLHRRFRNYDILRVQGRQVLAEIV